MGSPEHAILSFIFLLRRLPQRVDLEDADTDHPVLFAWNMGLESMLRLRAAGCVDDGLVCRTRWCLGGEGRRRRPDYRSGRSGGRVRGPLGACFVGVGRRECVLGAGGCCARRVFCLGWGEVGASADGRARSTAAEFVRREAACMSTGRFVGDIAAPVLRKVRRVPF